MRSPSRFAVPRPFGYVATGVLAGLAYAFLNTQTDDWARSGSIGRVFVAFHAFVDRGIPILAGGLLGLALHWLHLRASLARVEAYRAADLRSRLRHVERDQAVWVVVASALHELKNPLHTLGLLVDELEDVAANGDARALADQVTRVRAQVDRTVGPLDALKSLTRHGKHERRVQAIGETVHDVIATLKPLAAEVGVELRLEGDCDAPANVDAEYVRIVVDNLVINALEAREGGEKAHTVVVRMRDEPELSRVVLRVSDDGPGLDGAQRSTIFEPLQTTKVDGLGLGLPIARALARALGGDLTATDEPGFATSFEWTVPVGSDAS